MLAITNGKIFTVENGTIEDGTVLAENGKITAVGANVQVPAGANVIDAKGKWVTPGLIEAHCHVGVKGEPSWMPSTSDILETTDPITPANRAIDGLNPDDWAIPLARSAGFTTLCSLPGSGNLICGQSVVFKPRNGATVQDIVVHGYAVQMKMALGENPIRIHGGKRAPMSRQGNAGVMRETLFKARNYANKCKAAQEGKGNAPEPDFKLDALVPVVRGEMLCRIHCHRADDMVTAGRIAKEFGLLYSIEHATEGMKILPYLKENNITCVVGPLSMEFDKRETWYSSYKTPGMMEKAGINFCMQQDARSQTRALPFNIGMAIARGLSFEAALRAVTINPARLLQLESRIGSIEVGKDADLAIFNGNPFSSLTLCQTTIIEGVVYNND